MPRYEENLYYYPEKSGFELVASGELSEPSYSFDTVIVLKRLSDNTFWAAHDSGCSCPTPFEDRYFPGDFTQIKNWREIKDFIAEYQYDSYDSSYSTDQIVEDTKNAMQVSSAPALTQPTLFD